MFNQQLIFCTRKVEQTKFNKHNNGYLRSLIEHYKVNAFVEELQKINFSNYENFLVQIFFNWDSLHARLNSHYQAWSYKKKNHKKITAYKKSV